MNTRTSRPSREEILQHGVPAELIEQLRGEARMARAQAIVAATRAALKALRHALRGARVHSLDLKTKAL